MGQQGSELWMLIGLWRLDGQWQAPVNGTGSVVRPDRASRRQGPHTRLVGHTDGGTRWLGAGTVA